MRITRRQALASATVAAMTPSKIWSALADKAPTAAGKEARPRLGIVTYNIAQDWDVPTIIKNLEKTKFEGVELRTTHAHGVEVSLSAAQRAEVKKRFMDSKVELMGLGSIFEYHSPDPGKLRKQI